MTYGAGPAEVAGRTSSGVIASVKAAEAWVER